jgi:hypothetical protein
MISYADSLADREETRHPRAEERDHEPTYEQLLQTLEICPLGQDDDSRHLTRSVILGEN